MCVVRCADASTRSDLLQVTRDQADNALGDTHCPSAHGCQSPLWLATDRGALRVFVIADVTQQAALLCIEMRPSYECSAAAARGARGQRGI